MTRSPELSEEEIIKGLCVAGDRELLLVRSLLEGAGFNLLRDGRRARAWCAREAENGSAVAQFALAKLLILGLYGERDVSKRDALKWCEKAANQDFEPAILMLAGFHESGWGGLEPSPARGLELIKAAVKRRYTPAMTALAAQLLTGPNAERERPEALQLLRDAAELGDAAAQYSLGSELLESGDHGAGLQWIRKAADQNHPGAHAALGNLYWDGSHGVPKDQSKSRHHLDLSAKLEEQSYAGLVP